MALILAYDVAHNLSYLFTQQLKFFAGCVCVYSSVESLEYIRSSMLKILEADQEGRLDGLPMIIMLAYEPYTQKELSYLRDNGKVLADR